MPPFVLTRFSYKWIPGSQLWHKEPYHVFTHQVLSCCSQVFNSIVEWIAWTFRYWHQESSVCSLQHKAYVRADRAVLNRNQHAIWAIWDFSGTLLRDWLLLMAGSSCTTILSDSFPLYFCGCFSLCPWPVYLKTVWSILLSCSQIFDQMCSLRLAGTECDCVWVCVARV